MGLFMFLSGMVRKNQHTNYYDTINLIKKRFIRLIIPFLSWGIINSLISKDNIYQIIKFSDKGLWFLPTLFIICCIFDLSQYFSFKYKKNSNKIFICFAYLVLLYIVNYITGGFSLWLATYYFIYYLGGVIYSRYSVFIYKYSHIIIPTCIIIYLKLFPSWMFGQVHTLPDILYNYIIGFCAILTIVLLVKKFYRKEHCCVLIAEIGLNSLTIYASHFYLIWTLIFFLNDLSIHPIITCIIIFIFSTIGSMIINKLLSSNKITSLLFIGK